MPTNVASSATEHGEGGDDRGAAPAVLVGPQEAEHEQEQGGGEGDLAGDVDLAGARVARLHDLRAGDPQAPRAEGHVDEEDPLPVQAARQRAADERADGERRADGGAVGGQGAGALLGLGEGVGEDRQRDGEHHGGAQALGGARGDERLDRRRRPRRRRRRAVKRARPPVKRRRRPKRSASEPAVSTTLASASVYASTTHCRPLSPVPRSSAIRDSAVFDDRDVEHEHRGGDADDGEGPALRGHGRQRRRRRRIRAGGCPARRR